MLLQDWMMGYLLRMIPIKSQSQELNNVLFVIVVVVIMKRCCDFIKCVRHGLGLSGMVIN